jgi:hypothetical protein
MIIRRSLKPEPESGPEHELETASTRLLFGVSIFGISVLGIVVWLFPSTFQWWSGFAYFEEVPALLAAFLLGIAWIVSAATWLPVYIQEVPLAFCGRRLTGRTVLIVLWAVLMVGLGLILISLYKLYPHIYR